MRKPVCVGCVINRNPTLAKLRRNSKALPETAVVPKTSLERQRAIYRKDVGRRIALTTSTNSSKRPWLSCVRNSRCTGYRSIWISAKAFRVKGDEVHLQQVLVILTANPDRFDSCNRGRRTSLPGAIRQWHGEQRHHPGRRQSKGCRGDGYGRNLQSALYDEKPGDGDGPDDLPLDCRSP